MGEPRCQICEYLNTTDCIIIWPYSGSVCESYKEDWIKVIKYG